MPLQPGTPDQIKWNDDNWIIWDVGFAESDKSSGLLMPHERPKLYTFDDARRLIVGHIKDSHAPTNLVIEAPLSVCFNEAGNPTPRMSVERVEVDGKIQYRRWYQAGGIIVAAMYVVRAIADAAPTATVTLFEGFVSYKTKRKP